jgi:hypothetical protein
VYSKNDGNATYVVPADDSKTTWRYLTFPSFVSVLQTKQMFFSRLEDLEDPYEGRFTDVVKCHFPTQVVAASEQFSRHNLCVNCWHMNEYESAAMWAIYAESGTGIAIRSTIGRMKASLHVDPRDVSMCEVQYVDFSQFGGCDRCFSLNLKRKSFEHEREVRLWRLEADHHTQDLGVSISVDPDELIDQVYISPKAEHWLKDLVDREMVTYHLNRAAIRSELYSPDLR